MEGPAAKGFDSMMSANVVVGVNDDATRAGIRLALEFEGMNLCAEALSVKELVDAADRCRPDVCLVDVELRGGGLYGAAEVIERIPGTAVVMLVPEIREAEFLEAMRIGAAGYLPKSIPSRRLPDVVRAVMKGQPAVPRSLVITLINQYRERPSHRYLAVANGGAVDLTSREWEVLDLMREGLSTRKIAARLLISEVTVRRHIGSALKKLHVETRADALTLLQSA